MEPDEPKTEVFAAPPTEEWEDPKPRYFGVTPHGLAAVLAAFAFGAGVVLLVAGSVIVGVLLLVAAVLLALIWLEQARRSHATAFDRTRALAGFTGSSVRAWTRAGREITGLRLEASRLAKRRAQLQYALGGAAYAGDEPETARLRDDLRAIDEQIAACVARANEVVEEMRRTTARERLAVAPTEVRPSDDKTA